MKEIFRTKQVVRFGGGMRGRGFMLRVNERARAIERAMKLPPVDLPLINFLEGVKEDV